MLKIKNEFVATIPIFSLRFWQSFICVFLAITIIVNPVLAQLAPTLPLFGVQVNVSGPMGTQVNSFNGNLYYSREDLTIPGRGMPLLIGLAYNSGQSNIDNAFGYGWEFSYDLHYVKDGNDIIIQRGDGRVDKYIRGAGSGKVVVNNDEWPLSDEGFAQTPEDAAQFALNVANLFTGGSSGDFLVYSDGILANTGLAGYQLEKTMTDAGHTWTIEQTTKHFTLEDLLMYDGIFLAGVAVAGGVVPPDTKILTDYVKAGGNIYLAGGTALGRAQEEADQWNPFLNECGLEFEPVHNSIDQIVPINSSHSLFNGVNNLFQINGNSITKLIPSDPRADILVEFQGEGLYATCSIEKFISPLGVRDTLDEYAPYLFRLTSPDGIQTFFDSSDHKHVTSIRDPNGNSLTFTYDGAGQLTIITYTSGRQLDLSYTNGHLTAITDLNTTPNRTIQLHYDGSDNLISITDVGGNTTTYGYSGNLLASITDPRGNTASIDYIESSPGSGKFVVRNISTDLTSKSFDYDEDSQTTTVTDVVDGQDQVTKYAYDSQGRISYIENGLGHSVSMAWDDKYNLTSSTDENGHTTSYTYDDNNNVLTVTNPLDQVTTYTYDDIFNKVTSIQDANGHMTTYEYDSAGNLVETTDPLGNKTTFTYEENGDLISKTDANNHATTMTYNANGDLASIEDPLGHTTSFTYDNVGNVLTMTDANVNTVNFFYDMLNRMTSFINPLDQETSTIYDANGNKISITDAKGSSIAYAYDALNRLVQVTDALGNRTNYGYNEMGKLRTIEDGNGHTTNFTFDRANRLESETDPEGNTVNYDYDNAGNLINRTDANGSVTSYTYDKANRLKTIATPDQQIVNDKVDFVVAGTSFDPKNIEGGLAGTFTIKAILTNTSSESIDAPIKAVVHTLTGGNLLLSATEGDGSAGSKQAIKVAGEVLEPEESVTVKFIIGLAEIKRFSFFVDVEGRIPTHISYSYDYVGNLTHMSNSHVSVIHSHDKANRLTNVDVSSNEFKKSLSYTYDAVGNRKTMTDPDRGVTTYIYDKANRLITLVNPALETTSFTYDDADRLIRQDYHNDTYALRTYDFADQLISIIHKDSTDTPLFAHFYEYDTTGNRVRMTNESGGITKYEYDDLDRIIGVTYPTGTTSSYAYDVVGNRTQLIDNAGTTHYTYDGANRLLSAGTKTYNWDNNGNQISKVGGTIPTTYSYDGLNRLTSITFPGGGIKSFSYYPNGQRLSTTYRTGRTIYHLYNDVNTLMDIDSRGTTIARYTSGLDVDKWISMERGGATSYYHQDGLNSIVGITDVDSFIAQTYQYGAFGNATSENGDVVNPFRYTGRQLESKSGLYDYRSRFYDPEVGRFLSKDLFRGIIEAPETTHPYTYVANNPIVFIDPFGAFFRILDIIVIGFAETIQVVVKIGFFVFTFGFFVPADDGQNGSSAIPREGQKSPMIGPFDIGGRRGKLVLPGTQGNTGGSYKSGGGGPGPTVTIAFTVNSTADTVDANIGDGVCADADGACTLRAAIQETNALSDVDTINVPAGSYTLNIPGANEDASATGDLDITDDLTIIGVSATSTIIDGGGLDRVFHVPGELTPTPTIEISSVTIRNGSEFFAGGILNEGGTVRVINNTIDGNRAAGSDGDGGGILNDGGTVWLINSTVSRNTAGFGTGISNFNGTVRLINSTVSGNIAVFPAGFGPAVFNSEGGTVILTNSTIGPNTSGIDNAIGTVQLRNTILAAQLSGSVCLRGLYTSLGHNLDQDGSCNLKNQTDIIGQEPLLGPLQNNGGPTETHALLCQVVQQLMQGMIQLVPKQISAVWFVLRD